MREASLELTELLKQANRLKDSIPALADTDEFTDRTVYYYAQQGLLPRSSRRRGPGTRYPRDFVDRLLFIRRLQKEQSLTLANIRDVMENVSAETIHNVGRGLEPLEIRIGGSYGAEDVKVHPEAFELGSPLDMMSDDFCASRVRSPATPSQARVSEPDRSMTEFAGKSPESCRRQFRIGSDAELTVKKTLTPLQEKRVEQMVELLRSILEEEG